MKIAVTYDEGNIFQHFGKTESFKVYEVQENQIVSSEVISSGGAGHGALAGAARAVSRQTCSSAAGIGEAARQAPAQAGIEVCAGAQGDCDRAVEAYLKGEFRNLRMRAAITITKRITTADIRAVRLLR